MSKYGLNSGLVELGIEMSPSTATVIDNKFATLLDRFQWFSESLTRHVCCNHGMTDKEVTIDTHKRREMYVIDLLLSVN